MTFVISLRQHVLSVFNCFDEIKTSIIRLKDLTDSSSVLRRCMLHGLWRILLQLNNKGQPQKPFLLDLWIAWPDLYNGSDKLCTATAYDQKYHR